MIHFDWDIGEWYLCLADRLELVAVNVSVRCSRAETDVFHQVDVARGGELAGFECGEDELAIPGIDITPTEQCEGTCPVCGARRGVISDLP